MGSRWVFDRPSQGMKLARTTDANVLVEKDYSDVVPSPTDEEDGFDESDGLAPR